MASDPFPVMVARVHSFGEHEEPARRLAAALGWPWHPISLRRFPDGESLVRVVPEQGIAVVYCPLDRPNGRIVDLLLAASALRDAGARMRATAPGTVTPSPNRHEHRRNRWIIPVTLGAVAAAVIALVVGLARDPEESISNVPADTLPPTVPITTMPPTTVAESPTTGVQTTSTTAVLDGDATLVRLPDPARFALHKLLLSARRPAAQQTKARKDREQASEVLELLASERPGDVRAALAGLRASYSSAERYVRQGAARLPARVGRELVLQELASGGTPRRKVRRTERR